MRVPCKGMETKVEIFLNCCTQGGKTTFLFRLHSLNLALLSFTVRQHSAFGIHAAGCSKHGPSHAQTYRCPFSCDIQFAPVDRSPGKCHVSPHSMAAFLPFFTTREELASSETKSGIDNCFPKARHRYAFSACWRGTLQFRQKCAWTPVQAIHFIYAYQCPSAHLFVRLLLKPVSEVDLAERRHSREQHG